MDDLRKAAKMALEALEWRFSNVPETIEALRQALAQPWDTTDMAYRPNGLSVEQSIAQPEQEPVAWMYVNEDGECEQIEYGVSTIEASYIKLLYTAPPSKPWVGLENIDFQYQPPAEVITMKYAEAILKEKNT